METWIVSIETILECLLVKFWHKMITSRYKLCEGNFFFQFGVQIKNYIVQRFLNMASKFEQCVKKIPVYF